MALLHNIVKPPIPCEVHLKDGNLTPTHTILIKGQVSTLDDSGFAVNLALGPGFGDKSADIALHFNPRIQAKYVARTSCQNRTWGGEETGNGMPFKINSPFLLQISTDLYCYKISVDGQYFCSFKHRLPLSAVNTITVEGKVDISCIQVYGPETLGTPPKFRSGCCVRNQPIFNPAVPLTTAVSGGLHDGKMIFISGIPTGRNRFTIYLQEGTSSNADVGLVFDVRFNFGSSIDTIVRNHRCRALWGQDERKIPHFPFKGKTQFEILILCEKSQFKVAVNNQHFITFKHRLMPFARFNMLVINGDVSLNQVRFQ